MFSEIQFYKYQGTGNDFILLDQYHEASVDYSRAQIEQWCDRRFGVGADGLMYLRKAEEYDFEMVYFNSDGRPSTMCGNGGRCIVKFAYDLGIIKEETTFLAVDGPHTARVLGEEVSLGMIDVHEIKSIGNDFELNTGSPHYVSKAEHIDELSDIVSTGKLIRYSERYQEKGINVNKYLPESSNRIHIATYERGVEDETYSCGTGVTAVALVHGANVGVNEVEVVAKGGVLKVSFERDGSTFKNISLIGPATKVFTGKIKQNVQ